MTTEHQRRLLRPISGDSWIARVISMIERCAPPLMISGDVADDSLNTPGKNRLSVEEIARIRRLYCDAEIESRPVDLSKIARRAGVSLSTVRNHTRDLRQKVNG